MDLSTIIKNIKTEEVLNFKDVDIKGISYNSNTINSHEIFVCLKGEHVDGHDFAQSAFEKGAETSCILRRLARVLRANGKGALPRPNCRNSFSRRAAAPACFRCRAKILPLTARRHNSTAAPERYRAGSAPPPPVRCR